MFIFCISFVIGHFLTEPLHELALKTKGGQLRNDGKLYPDGRLYEADVLTRNFLELAQKNAQQQQDLALKQQRQNDFISDVAHELKTPLTAIRGNAEILSDPDLPPDLHDKFCNIIVSESERLSRLTHDLLALQRIEAEPVPAKMQRINLRELAVDVVETLASILHERHAHVHVIGEAPDVLGNPDSLRQAVTNLVENASRFVGPAGNIRIELYGMNGNAIIAVKDDGEGFGDVDPKLLFDRFYRTDLSRARGTGGTGLGLAIVKSIVDNHDGSVEAFNLDEGGACFMIALPCIPADLGNKKQAKKQTLRQARN